MDTFGMWAIIIGVLVGSTIGSLVGYYVLKYLILRDKAQFIAMLKKHKKEFLEEEGE